MLVSRQTFMTGQRVQRLLTFGIYMPIHKFLAFSVTLRCGNNFINMIAGRACATCLPLNVFACGLKSIAGNARVDNNCTYNHYIASTYQIVTIARTPGVAAARSSSVHTGSFRIYMHTYICAREIANEVESGFSWKVKASNYYITPHARLSATHSTNITLDLYAWRHWIRI